MVSVSGHRGIDFTYSDTRINELLQHLHTISDLSAAQALADWDFQTGGMPGGAGEARGHMAATLEGLLHERWTSPRLGELLQTLEASIDQQEFTDADRGLIRQAVRSYKQMTKLPKELVEEIERARVASHEAWEEARTKSDFSIFAPHLKKMVDYHRQIADLFGYNETRYDALLDIYEPGLTASKVEQLFAPIRDVSISLLQRIQQHGKKIDTSSLFGDFSVEKQKQLCERLLANMGYDFTYGKIAISTHPFTTSIGSPLDVRLTVRYSNYLPMAIMSALHEGGHAVYEQGSDRKLLRTSLAGGTSLGAHESQSRLWENAIGRSEAYWQGQYAHVQEIFPEQFSAVDIQTFALALNHVEPSLIRVEADEVTYNLHIIIRFEIEKALFNDNIAVESLPDLWKAKYQEYLGVMPDNDVDGILQDVHWSSGFGYFPTYTLGNLYGAQIYHTLRNEFADFDARLAAGETGFILNWLQERMYSVGAIYFPDELIERLTGAPADPAHFVKYLTEKFTKIYDLPTE